jgi:hypothetical protein
MKNRSVNPNFHGKSPAKDTLLEVMGKGGYPAGCNPTSALGFNVGALFFGLTNIVLVVHFEQIIWPIGRMKD